jgi:hypothetical protein
MRQIIVEQGNEFKVKVREIKNNIRVNDIFTNDIFGDAYKQAALRVEEIVAATKSLIKSNNGNLSHGDYLNNIIAFTGERGQGKSSAMISFTEYLKKLSNIDTNNVFAEATREFNFISLETIDPSAFEDMNNILEVVIARMYNNFESKYRFDNTCVPKDKKNKIMNLFQKVYESLCLIRNPKKLEELEYDYEGSIQRIARIGDSTNLKADIIELVREYLSIFTEGNQKGFLIIPIDDLDINIKYAYKITEQIRKYLIIPNVIIIMAINIEQLKKCVEKEFREQLSLLINEKNRLSKDEPVNMAARYVEKLIPDGRKISLPEIRAISQNGNDDIELIYYKGEIENNLLKRVNWKGIEKTLLGYIFEKTGIAFIKPQNDVHNIIPNTLREVVNLLSVLGKMKDRIDRKTQLLNINIFEDYFLNTWIPSNLDDGHINIIRELYSENNSKKHRFICTKLMEILETHELYTVDIRRSGIFDKAKNQFYTKNKDYMQYSLGDVISWVDFLGNRYIDNKINNFVFAIKTIYSISMNKMILNETGDVTNQPNRIYQFIGGDIWGYNLDYAQRKTPLANPYIDNVGYRSEKVIRREQADRANNNPSRTNFEYDIKKVLGEEFEITEIENRIKPNNLNEEIARKIINMTFCSRYYIDKVTSNFISLNSAYRREAEFAIDQLLISAVDLKYLYVRSGFSVIENVTICDYVKKYIANLHSQVNEQLIMNIAANVELSSYIQKYCEINTDIKDKVYSDKIYFFTFIDTVEKALENMDYLSFPNEKLFLGNEEFKNELADLYTLLLQSKPSVMTDNKINANKEIIDKERDIFEGILKTPGKVKVQEIKEQSRKCTYITLKYKLLNLASNISANASRIQFSKMLVDELRKLYEECIIEISKGNEKVNITYELKEKYNKMAKEIRTTIEIENIDI